MAFCLLFADYTAQQYFENIRESRFSNAQACMHHIPLVRRVQEGLLGSLWRTQIPVEIQCSAKICCPILGVIMRVDRRK